MNIFLIKPASASLRGIVAGLVLAITAPASLAAEPGSQLQVSTDFEGGSAEVADVDATAGVVHIHPAVHRGRGWPCWWYLRISGLQVGQDLTLKVPITYSEAVLGTKIDVPTLNGGVKVKIPAGTPSGKTFRVKGKGITPDRGRAGDLLVTVQVAVPKKVTKEEREILESLDENRGEDLRSHLR